MQYHNPKSEPGLRPRDYFYITAALPVAFLVGLGATLFLFSCVAVVANTWQNARVYDYEGEVDILLDRGPLFLRLNP